MNILTSFCLRGESYVVTTEGTIWHIVNRKGSEFPCDWVWEHVVSL